jgi:protein-S-isoprenylcysteine O-methyltransferase Ste14
MPEKERIFTFSVVLQLLVFIVLVPMLPLIVPWQWDWWEAWVYALINIFGFIISRYIANRRSPGLLAERGKFLKHKNTEPWDQTLSPLLALSGGLLPLVVALEARFGPVLTFPLWVHLAAIVILLAGMVLASWALIANSYFSGMVRIQEDRGQEVIRSGPYRWIRHPGYSGALLTYFATPLLLDSVWGFLPCALLLVILVVRTSLEDRTLQKKLAGYREYAREVRFRLLPGIW